MPWRPRRRLRLTAAAVCRRRRAVAAAAVVAHPVGPPTRRCLASLLYLFGTMCA